MNRIYIDEDDSWSGLLMAAAFIIFSTVNEIKYYTLVQTVYRHVIITQLEHKSYCELIHQQSQSQINKDKICRNKIKK